MPMDAEAPLFDSPEGLTRKACPAYRQAVSISFTKIWIEMIQWDSQYFAA
jgi:hypothetical protein